MDADRVAALLLVSVEGAMTERATADADVVADVRAELDAYVDDRLLADGEDRQ